MSNIFEKIPKSFSLAGMDFKVIIDDDIDDGNRYGEFDECDSEIHLAKMVALDNQWKEVPERVMLNTFWHEMFHVFHYYFDTQVPENEAQVYANFMIEYERSKKFEETDKEGSDNTDSNDD